MKSEIEKKLRQLYDDIRNAELIPAKEGDTFEDGQRRSLDRTLICLFQLICQVKEIERASPWRKIESERDLPKENHGVPITVEYDNERSTHFGYYARSVVDKKIRWNVDGAWVAFDVLVIAWMPLPEPFEEK